jgi:parallel beta-helix repeat protein
LDLERIKPPRPNLAGWRLGKARIMKLGSWLRLVSQGTVVAAGVLAGAAPAMAQVACGDTIRSDARLSANLTCGSDPALTLIGPASLDMAGFTITCTSPRSDGIVIRGSGAQLLSSGQRGRVTACDDGVKLRGIGRHRVTAIWSDQNASDGFEIESRNNRLRRNLATRNRDHGFEINTPRNRLVNNVARRNDDGFRVQGSGNRLRSNTARNNRSDGIALESSAGGGLIVDNVSRDNGERGLDIESSNNTIEANLIVDNRDDGIRVRRDAENNRLRLNRTNNNRIDMRDDNPGCDDNTWEDNVFSTSRSDGSCIRQGLTGLSGGRRSGSAEQHSANSRARPG